MNCTGLQMNNNQPWICPRCTQVNAPWIPFCCKENKDLSKQLPILKNNSEEFNKWPDHKEYFLKY